MLSKKEVLDIFEPLVEAKRAESSRLAQICSDIMDDKSIDHKTFQYQDKLATARQNFQYAQGEWSGLMSAEIALLKLAEATPMSSK